MTPLNFLGILMIILMLFVLYNASEEGPFIFKNNEIKKIEIDRDSFRPNNITINQGDEVIWKNHDHVLRHTVVTNDPLIRNSDVLLKSDEFKVIFDRVGEFEFYSSLYPSFEHGVVIVKSGRKFRKHLKKNVLDVTFKLWRIFLKLFGKTRTFTYKFIKGIPLKYYLYFILLILLYLGYLYVRGFFTSPSNPS